MEVRLDGHDGPAVALPQQVAGVVERLQQDQHVWKQRLVNNPASFGDVEATVHHAFQEMADQVVAGLLADLGQQSGFEDDCKKSC